MKNVPHWQLLLLLYFVLVAVPVYIAHLWFKKKVLINRTYKNLLLYAALLIAIAFLMNFICMVLYFKFIFTNKI